MNEENKQKRQAIINSGKIFSLVLTGGGTGVLPMLLEEGGMSSAFIGAYIPYKPISKTKCYSFKYINDMIVNSSDGLRLTGSTSHIIACTASLRKHESEREGRKNGAYIKSVSWYVSRYFHIDLTFLDTRKAQEDYLAQLLFEVVYRATTEKLSLWHDRLVEVSESSIIAETVIRIPMEANDESIENN